MTDQIIIDRTPADHKFTAAWTYRDAKGGRYGVVARYDRIAGEGRPKVCLPFLDENGTLACKGCSVPCALYGLTDLIARPDDPVLVVEGEATADAGAKLFPERIKG